MKSIFSAEIEAFLKNKMVENSILGNMLQIDLSIKFLSLFSEQQKQIMRSIWEVIYYRALDEHYKKKDVPEAIPGLDKTEEAFKRYYRLTADSQYKKMSEILNRNNIDDSGRELTSEELLVLLFDKFFQSLTKTQKPILGSIINAIKHSVLKQCHDEALIIAQFALDLETTENVVIDYFRLLREKQNVKVAEILVKTILDIIIKIEDRKIINSINI